MNKVISVVAMCAGSFLLGGSLGLALSSYSCKLCMAEGDLERIKDKIVEELTEDELIELAYNENIERDLKEDQQDCMRYNRETGEYEPFEADEEVIATVEDLVESYISKDKKRPEENVKETLKGNRESLEKAHPGYFDRGALDPEYISKNDLDPHWFPNIEEDEEPATDEQEDSGDIIIVSTDSYLNEYEDYDKNTLTYYAGDDILVDSRDDVIFDTDEYVGPEALDKFGEGSDDENVVYVRNFNKKSDYEIVRDEGTFRETVLGYTSEYKLAKKARLNDGESEE